MGPTSPIKNKPTKQNNTKQITEQNRKVCYISLLQFPNFQFLIHPAPTPTVTVTITTQM